MRYFAKVATMVVVVLSCLEMLHGQVTLEGYVYQSGNRGFLNRVELKISGHGISETALTDVSGFFTSNLPVNGTYTISASKEHFKDTTVVLNTSISMVNGKAFLKLEMERTPGYFFEITLAEKRESENEVVDAIRETLVEVYNNTTQEEVLKLEKYPHPDFRVLLEKGNHYTLLIRKEGYLAKRMEAFVDVDGCILCFEGIGQIEPGVSDNLTEGNEMGVLLANVELEKIEKGKTFSIENIYYALGKWDLSSNAKAELNNVIAIFKDNPDLILELGSHTDSRGKESNNQELSQKRAQSAVDFLIINGDVPASSIIARGYGESKILNRCKNGVKCTEEEHRVNRRTELTIIGTRENDDFQYLLDMKKEEETNRLIEELQNQEQIKVKEGQSLEDALDANKSEGKKKIAASKMKGDQPISVINISTEVQEQTSNINYRVVVFFSNRALLEEHQIFKDFDNVHTYIADQSFYYYSVGKFNSKLEADSYLNKELIEKYPNAYVARYYKDKKEK